MTRSSRGQRLVPPALVEKVRNATPPAMSTSTQEASPFRIVAKGDKTADVYIYAEIGESWWGDSVSASGFLREVKELDVTEIRLHINSPGGDVFDAVAIYNTLVNHKASITVYVDGLAASAASFIAQAGDEIIMGRGSMFMIHDASGLAWGNAEEMNKTADVLDKISDTIAGFYAARAGGTSEEWRGIMKAEAWYSAEEAVDAGLADRVGSIEAPGASDIENRWDLSVFNYAGRQNAPSPNEVRRTVLNRISKEKNVADETTPQEVEAETPAVENTPETTGVETTGVETTATEDTQPVEPNLAAPQAEDAESLPPTTPIPSDSVQNKGGLSLVINGVRTSDPAKIQAHIDTLEGYAKESSERSRKEFVQNLANDNKIAASQIDYFENHVAGLTAEQFEGFVASWEAAPTLPLLGKHGVQDQTVDSKIATKLERLEVVRDIVAYHKAGNAKNIEQLDSYIEMRKLEKELGLTED